MENRKQYLKSPFYITVLALVLTACNHTNVNKVPAETGTKETAAVGVSQEPLETMLLTERDFFQELISNGKVTVHRRAELRFKITERIAQVWVKNGDRVQKDQPIAQLDLFRLEHSLAHAKDVLAQSKLDLQDVLIGRGYSIDHQELIPEEELALAQVKSGYNKALIAYELAQEELQSATLTAPFEGVIANLKGKAENLSSTGEVFCMVLDDKCPEVEFTVLESELALVKPGYGVQIVPFASMGSPRGIYGTVTEVNPFVESNGMVRVKARAVPHSGLLEGMNVKVTLRRPLTKSLVIPKSAVVMRSGKQVVFTRYNGHTKWNYVEVLAENSDSCIVAPRTKEFEGLSVGDTVLVSGNLNLAHDTSL